MEKTETNTKLKLSVIDKMIQEKEEVLEDFRTNQRNKLNQTSADDIDNKQHESKTEEVLNELELLNHNVEILEKEIILVRNVPRDLNADHVQFGSLVETDHLNLMVAAAHETMEVDGKSVLGISTAAPIFSKMRGLTEGDSFEINGKKHTIKAIS